MFRSTELPSRASVLKELNTIHSLNEQFPQSAERNAAGGLIAYSDGNLKDFKGFSLEDARRKLLVMAEFDAHTAAEIKRRVSDPLKELAAARGITFATEDEIPFRQHITVQKIDYSMDQENDLSRIQSTIDHLSPQMQNAANGLVGVTVPLNRLVLAGSNSYVCMDDPTQDAASFAGFWNIFTRRRDINTLYRRTINDRSFAQSGALGTNDDIIHSTIGRIARSNGANLVDFALEANVTMGKQLRENPIRARIGSIYAGSSSKYINSRRTT